MDPWITERGTPLIKIYHLSRSCKRSRNTGATTPMMRRKAPFELGGDDITSCYCSLLLTVVLLLFWSTEETHSRRIRSVYRSCALRLTMRATEKKKIKNEDYTVLYIELQMNSLPTLSKTIARNKISNFTLLPTQYPTSCQIKLL